MKPLAIKQRLLLFKRDMRWAYVFFSIYWVIAVPRFCIYGQGITISRVGEYKSNYKFIDICPILKDEIIFDFVDVLICMIAVVSLMFLVMVPAFFVACFPLRYIWKLPI